jgi:hypothetical protein
MNAKATEYRINVQCTDDAGKIGAFIRVAGAGNGYAPPLQHEKISPTFSDLADLFSWMKLNGWSLAQGVGLEFVPWRVVRASA